VPPPRRSKPRSPEHGALGEAIRTLRMEAGLSQEQLAEGAGTDLTQVGGIERGVRNPSYTTLLRLADALETTVGEIATLADELRESR
jgi:transcriptional regulator with XRE-family HTH domain